MYAAQSALTEKRSIGISLTFSLFITERPRITVPVSNLPKAAAASSMPLYVQTLFTVLPPPLLGCGCNKSEVIEAKWQITRVDIGRAMKLIRLVDTWEKDIIPLNMVGGEVLVTENLAFKVSE